VRPLHLALAPAPDAVALDALARALAPRVAELLASARTGAQLVDVVASVPAPKRSVMAACRAGKIEGARRVGRRWLASRASIDAWVRSCGARPVAPADADDGGDGLAATRAALLAAPRRRRAV
jgi:hypothetical protein